MIITWSQKLPWELINKFAAANKLNPHLVAAIVQTESEGIAGKTRFEIDYRWLVTPEKFAASLGVSIATEKMSQSFSYGLMQIMGGTARSLGYTDYLPFLVLPERGLEYGCKYLASCQARFPRLEQTIAAYNAGTPRDSNHDGIVDNQGYVDKVSARLVELASETVKPVA